jgi:hypothetical protein
MHDAKKPDTKTKRPPTSSDEKENPIRDDSGEEGKYTEQQQEGLAAPKDDPKDSSKP